MTTKPISLVREILNLRGEKNIDYLYWFLSNSKPKNSTKDKVALRKFKFLSLIFWNSKFRKDFNYEKVDFLILSRTVNQTISLESVLNSLESHSYKYVAITGGSAEKSITKLDSRFIPVKHSLADAINSIRILMERTKIKPAKESYDNLKYFQTNGAEYTEFRRKIFVYLAMFKYARILKVCRPTCVIVANDHTYETRSIISLANRLGLKTVYVQHASVTDRFPRLDFSFSFLDGEAAYNSYKLKEKTGEPVSVTNFDRKVFLSGQKKKLNKDGRNFVPRQKRIGIAVNRLDDIKRVFHTASDLSRLESVYSINIRLHPASDDKDIDQARKELPASAEASGLECSSAKTESLQEFLRSIDILVAGNSSIHLEAVLMNVLAVYFEFGPAVHKDYYGYISGGVAVHASQLSDLSAIVDAQNLSSFFPNPNDVRKYSRTYKTIWEGHEGELLIQTLLNETKFPFEKYRLRKN